MALLLRFLKKLRKVSNEDGILNNRKFVIDSFVVQYLLQLAVHFFQQKCLNPFFSSPGQRSCVLLSSSLGVRHLHLTPFVTSMETK
jgi:hypothetical protein